MNEQLQKNACEMLKGQPVNNFVHIEGHDFAVVLGKHGNVFGAVMDKGKNADALAATPTMVVLEPTVKIAWHTTGVISKNAHEVTVTSVAKIASAPASVAKLVGSPAAMPVAAKANAGTKVPLSRIVELCKLQGKDVTLEACKLMASGVDIDVTL